MLKFFEVKCKFVDQMRVFVEPWTYKKVKLIVSSSCSKSTEKVQFEIY